MKLEKTIKKIETFLKENTQDLNGCVLGISGGVDSAVVAYLSVNALGKEKVHGILMPYDKQSTQDALLVAEKLGISYETINIKPIVEAFKQAAPQYFNAKLSEGNLRARIRMCLLYGCSNTKKMIVTGTGNKSEIMIGYFTKHGDGAVDVLPIAHLYKTQVWEVAKQLQIPKNIVEKAPSAELWDGQTDENEIGLDYYTLDNILQGKKEGIEKKLVERVEKLKKGSWHKRILPRGVKK